MVRLPAPVVTVDTTRVGDTTRIGDTARVTPSGVSISISLLVLCEEHTDWFLP